MLEVFQYGFMIRAFLAGAVVAVIAPLIGVFLVLRRQSFFAETLSHGALLGVTIGFLAGTQPVVTAVVASVAMAAGMVGLRKKMIGDAVLAFFLYGSLAATLFVMGIGGGSNVDLLGFLFGSIVTVQPQDLYVIGALGVLVVAVFYLFHKEFLFVCFDEEAAKASGLPVVFYDSLLLVLAAVVVSLAIRTVGALLIGALIVIPVVAAMQLAQSFRQTILFSVAVASISVFFGLMLSYHLGFASGALIVAVAIALFFLSSLFGARLRMGLRRL